jgi:hypothetical protein
LYGKVFDSIYDGTLYGHWEAIVTMQQFIVLATPDGVVDMTPQAIAARTSIPLEIISKGIKVLEEPDPYTRTPGEDGRRIVLMDSHRPWGWRLVNHGKYMRLRNIKEKREADRARIAEKRKQNKDVAIESQPVANVAHSDSDLDVKNKKSPPPNGGPIWQDSLAILTASGFSEPAARGFLGLLCKDYSEDEIVNAVKAAMGKANVAAYIRGVLKERPKKGQTAKRMVI